MNASGFCFAPTLLFAVVVCCETLQVVVLFWCGSGLQLMLRCCAVAGSVQFIVLVHVENSYTRGNNPSPNGMTFWCFDNKPIFDLLRVG